ncbi:hypothetical protein EYF80_037409 [Liparis tanakae]|uniref:Uncharacterized protein n=1 Tax=Liparis tanakae TaxID=230148 RepID=A0A4Z2GFZ6_9TELE|nr:hypothetical protein EYF80_037409 [Liparis tanakae]
MYLQEEMNQIDTSLKKHENTRLTRKVTMIYLLCLDSATTRRDVAHGRRFRSAGVAQCADVNTKPNQRQTNPHRAACSLASAAQHRPGGAGARLLANGVAVVVHFPGVLVIEAPLGERGGRGRVLLVAIAAEKLFEVLSLVDPRGPGLGEGSHSCLHADKREQTETPYL